MHTKATRKTPCVLSTYIRPRSYAIRHTQVVQLLLKIQQVFYLEGNQPILSTMKSIVLALTLFSAVAFAAVEDEHELILETYNPVRFRREADPQDRGSISIQAQKPLSGPDRRPSVDIDYNQHIFNKNGATGSAYGGLNIRPGQPAQPHIGFKAEREFKNGYINGFGQVQRGPGGRPSPTFGANIGYRFRRDVGEEAEQQY